MRTILPPTEIGPLSWDWSRTCVMGVVNVTPDSFSDGGLYLDPEAAVNHGVHLAEAGADLLDVGGESTRPGALPVDEEEELSRVLPVIRGILGRCAVPVSVDTCKARVAREAVRAGASMINDISGMELDGEMIDVAVETGVHLVLGHLRGRPATMNQQIAFADVVGEVEQELRARVRRAVSAGVAPDRIWVDPGIGFGKTPLQSMALIRAAGQLREALGYPVLVGPSRKSFIGAVTGKPPGERLMGTCAAASAAIMAGADAVRVHDVAELADAIRVADAIARAGEGPA